MWCDVVSILVHHMWRILRSHTSQPKFALFYYFVRNFSHVPTGHSLSFKPQTKPWSGRYARLAYMISLGLARHMHHCFWMKKRKGQKLMLYWCNGRCGICSLGYQPLTRESEPTLLPEERRPDPAEIQPNVYASLNGTMNERTVWKTSSQENWGELRRCARWRTGGNGTQREEHSGRYVNFGRSL